MGGLGHSCRDVYPLVVPRSGVRLMFVRRADAMWLSGRSAHRNDHFSTLGIESGKKMADLCVDQCEVQVLLGTSATLPFTARRAFIARREAVAWFIFLYCNECVAGCRLLMGDSFDPGF